MHPYSVLTGEVVYFASLFCTDRGGSLFCIPIPAVEAARWNKETSEKVISCLVAETVRWTSLCWLRW